MSAVEIPRPAPVPRLLVELPSRPRVFFSNLRDLLFSPGAAALDLYSVPGDFWPDVFVNRPLPWARFSQSVLYHVLAGFLLIAGTRFFAMQPRVIPTSTFDRSQVIYYQAAENLPPLDTRKAAPNQPAKADPEFSRQPIISVPAEADNRSQTVVTPPHFKLNRDVALPNIVSWSDNPSPRLAIPDAPLTPAADIKRIAPTLDASVVAPPPDVHSAKNSSALAGLQPALIAPPPSVDVAANRPLGDLNIARSVVIAPAPQLPVAEQRSLRAGRSGLSGAPQVVAPPPSVQGSSAPSGSRGRVIALSLHPAVGAPPDSDAGNRRGTFAATPEGRAGASGSPGSSSGTGKSDSSASSGNPTGTLPSGLYVGKTAEKSSPVAGNGSSANSVNPNLIASARPPHVSPRTMQPASSANLTEPERAVFGNRRFYSLSLNLPNLNSGGGSWVIRFAELDHASSTHDTADLSQPAASRKVDPAYPLELMRQNVAGTVILYAVIHADGSVGNVRVLRSVDPRLDRFAREALSQWKFDPATKNGTAVDIEATFQIPFRPALARSNF